MLSAVRFLALLEASFSFNVVNSRLSGTGDMWKVPRVLFEVRSRELAAVMLEGLKRFSMECEIPQLSGSGVRLKGKIAMIPVMLSCTSCRALPS